MLLRLSLVALLFVAGTRPALADTATDVDTDRSGAVDFADFVAFARVMGKADAVFDLDRSGTVDFADFVTFAAAFGKPTGYRVIVFPDPVLYELILLQTVDFTASWLQTLDTLRIGDTRVRDFTGIEALTGLKYLQILGNSLADPTPIGALTGLETLHLTSVSFADPSFLTRLTNLRTLTVGTSVVGGPQPLKAVESVASLSGLASLTLYAQYVDDLSPLGRLTGLTSLTIETPLSADISWTAPLQNLRSLTLNRVASLSVDVTPLARLAKLERFTVTGPPSVTARQPTLIHVGTLASLPVLSSVSGEAVDIQDLKAFAGWPALSHLGLGNSPLSSLEGAGAIPNLKSLVVGPTKNARFMLGAQVVPATNTIVDLTPLVSASKLEQLILTAPRVADLFPLGQIATLRTVGLWVPKVTDFSIIASHRGLETLSIAGDRQDAVINVSTGGERLVYLNMEFVNLTATFANGLPSLETLVVTVNDKFVDFSGLGALDAIKDVRLSHIVLSDEAKTVQIPALEARGVRVTAN